MSVIIPVPTTRVSDLLMSQRLMGQLQADQLDLFGLQNQISTGRRFSLPSEDAPAARRAISLQRLLERKVQVQKNLATSQSFLSATDSSLSSVSSQLANVRGIAISVMGVTASDTQRKAAAQQVTETINSLVDAGNTRFRGRYLFAGTATTQQPFSFDGQYVEYLGNERELRSLVDLDLLTETNVSGDEVFGSLSTSVQGTADLNPVVTEATRIDDLRGGRGIADGSILISDGTSTSNIDLSTAHTVGDVLRQIEANPPGVNSITATVTSQGIHLELGSGTITVRNIGGGTTASDLGILEEAGNPSGIVDGQDLNPRLTLTTELRDILGSRAKTRAISGGANNDLQIEADVRGTGFNGVTVSFVDNPALAGGGDEIATYDAFAGTLTIEIREGVTVANDIVTLLDGDPDFDASLDFRDTDSSATAGNGFVSATATGVTVGGSGIEFDQSSGLQITNGDDTYNVSFASAETVESMLNIINGAGANVLADINQDGTGINIRSRISGANFTITENGGTTATELGLRTFDAQTRLTDLNHGHGVNSIDGTDFTIHRRDGIDLEIDVSGTETIQEVIDLINNHANNVDGNVIARVSDTGAGIELATTDLIATTAPFTVQRVRFSDAAIDLGLVPVGATVSDAAVTSGGEEVIAGANVNPQEVSGIFTALLRLHDALLANDQNEITRSVDMLDESRDDLNFTLAEIGARQQGLDVVQFRLETEEVELRASLSDEIDVDITEAITNLTARQIAIEASLRVAALTSQLTILDFL